MGSVVVRYKVKPDQIESNAALVRQVFAELAATRPEGLRYATVHDADGWFTHIASVETADGSNPLSTSPAFAAFQADLADRCEVPPQPAPVELVGSYRVFD